jgi:hypothetical protein
MKHDVFLCHTGDDKPWTEFLAEKLEARSVNNRGIKVFFDKWDIDYGFNILSRIDEGLRESRYVALVLSPAMVRAPWPTVEWQSQVMDDPTGKSGRILPLLVKRTDNQGSPIILPFVLKPLKRFDFSDPKRFDLEFEELVRRISDLPPARGNRIRTVRRGLGSEIAVRSELRQEMPETINESLASNLLLVTSLPDRLFSDKTDARKLPDVWSVLKGSTPPFFLFSERLYSFVPHDAKDNPFRPLLKGNNPQTHDTKQWMDAGEGTKQVIGLLNSGLKEHCYALRFWKAKKPNSSVATSGSPRPYFPPLHDDKTPRKFTWGSGRPRTLAMRKPGKGGNDPFCVHMAAKMRFIHLHPRLFLLVEPTWMFTTDGVRPVAGKEMGVFSTMWGGRERNAAVLRNVLMWGLLLSDKSGAIKINVGTPKHPVIVALRGVPARTNIGRGVFGDSIRMERILAGEGAGEMVATVGDEGVAELDRIATLALLGEPADAHTESQPSFEDDEEDNDDAGEQDQQTLEL